MKHWIGRIGLSLGLGACALAMAGCITVYDTHPHHKDRAHAHETGR